MRQGRDRRTREVNCIKKVRIINCLDYDNFYSQKKNITNCVINYITNYMSKNVRTNLEKLIFAKIIN